MLPFSLMPGLWAGIHEVTATAMDDVADRAALEAEELPANGTDGQGARQARKRTRPRPIGDQQFLPCVAGAAARAKSGEVSLRVERGHLVGHARDARLPRNGDVEGAHEGDVVHRAIVWMKQCARVVGERRLERGERRSIQPLGARRGFCGECVELFGG